jgi:hypothetical protein
MGDEPIDALIRECRREYDVGVKVGALIGAFTDNVFGSELALFYRCTLKSGDPRPADIVDAVEWFSVFAPPRIAYRSVDQAVRTLADLIGSP